MKMLIRVLPSVCLVAVLAALLLFSPAEARAAKLLCEMTPESLQHSGFSMKVENRKDGTIAFTLARDLAKARTFEPGSDLRLRRSATLKVVGKSGLIAECAVEPNEKNNTLTYRFVLARECVAASQFTLAEIEDYKEEVGEGYLGGGTLFEFRLAHFAAQAARLKKP
ncbi:hypothetical protein LBMAG56_06110 [Verrucomicrobiota bacterium]|nr:hypothetical protein LBMAG56_06110 [Verrucomicrobiota bacterium]